MIALMLHKDAVISVDNCIQLTVIAFASLHTHTQSCQSLCSQIKGQRSVQHGSSARSIDACRKAILRVAMRLGFYHDLCDDRVIRGTKERLGEERGRRTK